MRVDWWKYSVGHFLGIGHLKIWSRKGRIAQVNWGYKILYMPELDPRPGRDPYDL